MVYYAQINADSICFAVSELSGAVEALDMIPVDSSDMSLLGKRWTGENWEDVPQPPNPEPSEPVETTEQKLTRLEEQNIILMDALATTFEEVLTLRAVVEGGTV